MKSKTLSKDVAKCFKDWLIWLPALSYFGLIIPSYGYAYFAATIIKQMGYTAVSAQQHSVYPWVCAFGVINVVAFISDRLKKITICHWHLYNGYCWSCHDFGCNS